MNIRKLTRIASFTAILIATGALSNASFGGNNPNQANLGYTKGTMYLSSSGSLNGIYYERKCDGHTNVWEPVVPGAQNGIGNAVPFKHGCGTSNEQ